ncbi:MAG TPA: glycosyltransferase [Solirubrobacterales bacterium]|nr:glycosyltransferase [Solirubrobacterales bacterium]
MASYAATRPALPESRPDLGRDVVMLLGYTSWAGAVRRRQIHPEDQLTLKLIGSGRVGRLLVCNPFRSLPARLLRPASGEAGELFPASPSRRLHEPVRLRRTDSTRIGAIERSCARYERSVRKAAAELGLERPAVIAAHPLIAGFGRFEWAGPVTYYANDDLTAYPPLSPWWPAYEASFARLREAGRRAVGLTPKSLASVSPSGGGAVVPSGLIPDEWLRPGAAPQWFLDLPAPRMVYVGTLDERIDVASVHALAASRPEGSVVLIGREGDLGPVAGLGAPANVHLRPPIPRRELIALVAAADLGLVPHVSSEQTKAMSPLKLFEYLGAGIPVAATDLPGTASVCPQRVGLARDSHDFAAAADAALALGRWHEQARLDFIAENSWSQRFETLLDLALPDTDFDQPSISSRG